MDDYLGLNYPLHVGNLIPAAARYPGRLVKESDTSLWSRGSALGIIRFQDLKKIRNLGSGAHRWAT